MKTVLLALVGLFLALISKAAGRFVATVRKVDPQGARWTISEHLWLIGRCFGSAAVVALVILAVFLAPPSWATWVVIIGMIALVIGNLSLGGLAGTSESLGRFLGRAQRWAEIERLVRMKERTRRELERFLVVIVAVTILASFSSVAWAGRACAIVPDETASVRASSLESALGFIKATFFEYLTAMNCSDVVVVRLGAEPRFAKRTWLGPIPRGPALDCQKAEPLPLPSEASVFGLSRNVEIGLKDDAVARCKHSVEASSRDASTRRREFLGKLDDAFSFPQVVENSCVTGTARYLTEDDTFGSVVILSDLQDNPPGPVSGIDVPNGVSLVLIALEPDPKYGSIKDVTVRMRLWERKPNVTVLTVNELQPGLWAGLASKR